MADPLFNSTRNAKLKSLEEPLVWDAIVVGGGITGAGVYRELALRGLKVLLLEQQDFAWGTSSRSSKMVHGGLRYLGKGQLGLARDSVLEREKLMHELPGLVDPLPFMLGHYEGKFPGPWLFGKLLAVYDWLAGRLTRGYVGQAIKDFWVPGIATKGLKGASSFGDAVTDDARLVMRVLQEADANGGTSINYLKAVKVDESSPDYVNLMCEDSSGIDSSGGDSVQITLETKSVINATGAWSDTLRSHLGRNKLIRPLRGSHLIVPFWRLPVSFAVSFMHPEDGRPVFAFPWEGSTVIGTTDLDHDESLNHEPSITKEELDYLLKAAAYQFDQYPLTESDIISSWSGVRPVVLDQKPASSSNDEKPSDANREHVVLNEGRLITIAGGKLTTFRLIAMEVLEGLKTLLKDCSELEAELAPSPFARHTLGPSHDHNFSDKHLQFENPIGSLKRDRLAGRYGESYFELLSIMYETPSLAKTIGTTDTLWAELAWSCERESIVHLDDLLLRRSRLGLLLPFGAQQEFEQIKAICQPVLGWSDAKWDEEVKRYKNVYKTSYSLPRGSQVRSKVKSTQPHK